jgi:hypothetical protein
VNATVTCATSSTVKIALDRVRRSEVVRVPIEIWWRHREKKSKRTAASSSPANDDAIIQQAIAAAGYRTAP